MSKAEYQVKLDEDSRIEHAASLAGAQLRGDTTIVALLSVGCHECGRAYDDAQIAICRNPKCSAAAAAMDVDDEADYSTCAECGQVLPLCPTAGPVLCDECNAVYEAQEDEKAATAAKNEAVQHKIDYYDCMIRDQETRMEATQQSIEDLTSKMSDLEMETAELEFSRDELLAAQCGLTVEEYRAEREADEKSQRYERNGGREDFHADG